MMYYLCMLSDIVSIFDKSHYENRTYNILIVKMKMVLLY